MKYLILLLLFSSCTSSSPKFKVGECSTYPEDHRESWETDPTIVRQIIKIGSKKYQYRFISSDGVFITNGYDIKIMDKYSTKVECPNYFNKD